MNNVDTFEDDKQDLSGVAAHAWRQVEVCEDYLTEQSKSREKALEYYNGEMNDMKADEGRSSVVMKTSRDMIKKLKPSIMRAFFGNDKVVEYIPTTQEAEQGAQQATDYVNHVVIAECNAKRAISDAFDDAFVLKTGILKWSAYKNKSVQITEYSNISDEELLGLLDDPNVEILDHEISEETDPLTLSLNPEAQRNSFRLKKIEDRVDPKLEAVPRGSFLIDPMAETIEESSLVGERLNYTRSDLVSMGYDKDDVWAIPEYSSNTDDEDDDFSRMGEDWTDLQAEKSKAMHIVRVYEVYFKVDLDDDGIAEMYRMVFSETGQDSDNKDAKHIVLDFEPVDEAPYAEVIAEPDAHQFEGHSVDEDVRDVQKVNTALMRSTLDNMYWQNNPQQYVDQSALVDGQLDSVSNPQFGRTLFLKKDKDAKKAVQYGTIPLFADKSFAMLDKMDQVAKDRTGITDASGGVAPEALANTSATAANLMSESGVAQAGMTISWLSEGVQKAFEGILRLVVAHHDKPRTIRLRGEWVEYNPSMWSPDMRCTVNVGLGTGTRERDVQVLNLVKNLQAEIVGAFGVDNGMVTPTNMYNTLEKICEASGLASAEPYFTKPNEQEITAKLKAQAEKPTPEQEKMQAQMQLEQGKLQSSMQLEQMKMQSNRDKEAAQMQADLQVKNAEIQAETIRQQQELESKAIIEQGKIDLAREKMVHDEQMKQMEIDAKLAIEGAKIGVSQSAPDGAVQ